MPFSKKITFLMGAVISILLFYYVLNTFNHSKVENYTLSTEEFQYKLTLPPDGLNQEIASLEQRPDLKSMPSDLISLAEFYLKKAKRTADPDYFLKAEAIADQVLKTSDANKQAQLIRVQILISHHQFTSALEFIEQSVGKNFNPDWSYLRVSALLAIGQYNKALDEVDQALQLKPSSVLVTAKALLLSQIGQDELAFFYFKRAIQIEDLGEEYQSTILRGQFAQFLLKKGNANDALKLCADADKIIFHHHFIQFVRSQALNSLKKYSESLEVLTSAFAESRDPALLVQLVFTSLLAGKDSSHLALSKKAIDLLSAEMITRGFGHSLDLAGLYYGRSEFDNALKVLNADSQRQTTYRHQILLAKIYFQMNDLEKCRSILEQMAYRNVTEPSVFYLMSKVLLKNKNSPELVQAYQNLGLKLNPNYNDDFLLKLPW